MDQRRAFYEGVRLKDGQRKKHVIRGINRVRGSRKRIGVAISNRVPPSERGGMGEGMSREELVNQWVTLVST